MSFFARSSKDSPQKTSPLLLVEKYQKYWNEPCKSRGDAIHTLQHKPIGTFLFRKSEEDTKEGLFLLVSLKEKVHTVKIHFDAQNGYKLVDCKLHFHDVHSLIAHHCSHVECNCCTLVKLTLKTFSAMNHESFRDNHLHNDIRINNDTIQSNEHGVKFAYQLEGITFENVLKDGVESNTIKRNHNENNISECKIHKRPANISNPNINESVFKDSSIYDFITKFQSNDNTVDRLITKSDTSTNQHEHTSLGSQCKKKTNNFHDTSKDVNEHNIRQYNLKKLFICDIDFKCNKTNYLSSSSNTTKYKNLSENNQNYNQIDVATPLENAPFKKETSLKDYNNNYFNRSLGSCGFDKTSNLYNTINDSYDIRNNNINENNQDASSFTSLQNNSISDDHKYCHYDNLRPHNHKGAISDRYAAGSRSYYFQKKISRSDDYGINKNLNVFNNNVGNWLIDDLDKNRDGKFNDYDNVSKVYKLPANEPVRNIQIQMLHYDYDNICSNNNNDSCKNINKNNTKKSFIKKERRNQSPKSSSSSPGDSLKESISDDSPIYKQPYTQEDEQILQRYKSRVATMRSASFYKASQKLTVPTHYNIPSDVTPTPKFNPPSSDAQHFFPEDFRCPSHHTSSTNSQSLDAPSTNSDSVHELNAPSITDLLNTCREVSTSSAEISIKPTKTPLFYSQNTAPSNSTNKFYDRHTDVLRLSNCPLPKTFQDDSLKNTGAVDFDYKGCDNYVIENTFKSDKIRKSSMPYSTCLPFVDDKKDPNTELYRNEKIKRKSSLSDKLYDDALTIENPNAMKSTKQRASFKNTLSGKDTLIEESEFDSQQNSPPLPPRLSTIPPPIPPRVAPQMVTNRHTTANCRKHQVCIQPHITHHNTQVSHNKSNSNYSNCFIEDIAPIRNTASIKCRNDNYLNFKAQRTLSNKNNYSDNSNTDMFNVTTPIDEYKLKPNDLSDKTIENLNENRVETNTETNIVSFVENDKNIHKSKSFKIKLENIIRGIKKKNFSMKCNRNTLSTDTNNNNIVRKSTAKDGMQAPQHDSAHHKHKPLIRSLSERDNIGGVLVEEFVRATKGSNMQNAVSMTVHIRQFMDGLANYVRNEGFCDEMNTLSKRDKDRHIEEVLTDLIIRPLYRMLCQSFGRYRQHSFETLQQLRINDDNGVNDLVNLIKDKVDMSGWMYQGISNKLQQLSSSLDQLAQEMVSRRMIERHQILLGVVTCVSMALMQSGPEVCIQADILVALVNKQLYCLDDDLYLGRYNDHKGNDNKNSGENRATCDNNDNTLANDNCFYSLFILSSALHTMHNVWSSGCVLAEPLDNIMSRNTSRYNPAASCNNNNNKDSATSNINDKFTCDINSDNNGANKSDNNINMNKIITNTACGTDGTKVLTKGMQELIGRLADFSVKVQFSLGDVVVPFNLKTTVLDIKRAVKRVMGVSVCVQCLLRHSFEPKTTLADELLIHTLIPNKGSRLSAPVNFKSSIINSLKKLKSTKSVKKQSITAASSIIPCPRLFVLEVDS